MIPPGFQIGKTEAAIIVGIRLGAGTCASVLLYLALPNHKLHVQALKAVERKGLLLCACILSTYISMMLWVAGYSYDDAAIVAVLNQTSTLFTVGLAALLLNEPFTRKKFVATSLAVAGVLIIAMF